MVNLRRRIRPWKIKGRKGVSGWESKGESPFEQGLFMVKKDISKKICGESKKIDKSILPKRRKKCTISIGALCMLTYTE